MPLPRYTYVPGHQPHPTRDRSTHRDEHPTDPPSPLDPELWMRCAAYVEGITLFDRGYYWEAHEAWEGLWAAAGRTGAIGDLLNGLIKLAAAGVKHRQGLPAAAARLIALARGRFDRAQAQCDAPTLAGMAFASLHALAQGARAAADPSAAVQVVFAGTLMDDADTATREATLAYHRGSKHLPGRFAPSLGYMDWNTQPDPFRRFDGAPCLPLALPPIEPQPRYEPAFVLGQIDPAPLDVHSIARLFHDSLALSAWKAVAGSRWPLRVNPSSGNLHPTEGYLVAGAVHGLHTEPAVYHYAPRAHALERRVILPAALWCAIAAQLPAHALLVGLTSIHWRESWKYGERAFRYCQHDIGHAIACIAIAAAGLGWEARLLEDVVDRDLATLLGVDRQRGIEAEHPDCLIAVYPATAAGQRPALQLDPAGLAALQGGDWIGTPNRLSGDHHLWPAIDAVTAATEKHAPAPERMFTWAPPSAARLHLGTSPLPLRQVIHQRRSAVALDGRTGITRAAFDQILRKTLPGAHQIPFTALPWRPCVDLLLLVHRVQGLSPGLYALVRDVRRKAALQRAMEPGFAWHDCGQDADVPGLFMLEEGDARRPAQQTSCNQEIAADGVFAVAMLAEYRAPITELGPWFYRRLFWETGAIGQVLYLEAEASGIRGTGIGCFFDDLTHRIFGLTGDAFQVLYHFTMGGPVEDARLRTEPPYDHLRRDETPPD